jgi:hypothetical protein
MSLRHHLFDRIGAPLETIANEMESLTEKDWRYDTCKDGHREFLRHYRDELSRGANFVAKMATFHPDLFADPILQPYRGDFEIEDLKKHGRL